MTPEEIAKLPYRPCAGVCLTRPDGQIWVGERLDRPAGSPVAWQMPQGGIDKGETPEAAALRELREETGLRPEAVRLLDGIEEPLHYDLPPELLGKVWKGRYRGQAQYWFRMEYDGPDDAVDLDYHHREFARWRWMAGPDVVAAIVPFKRDIYAKVLGRFGLI
ncbi:MAG: RNA pyrophosphohydrolase [Pseudomonadota bacterium]